MPTTANQKASARIEMESLNVSGKDAGMSKLLTPSGGRVRLCFLRRLASLAAAGGLVLAATAPAL